MRSEERFADRLDIRWDIEESALAVAVSTLLLPPLVENAIRHGAAAQPGRCEMTVSARLVGHRVHLSVSDAGAGLPPVSMSRAMPAPASATARRA